MIEHGLFFFLTAFAGGYLNTAAGVGGVIMLICLTEFYSPLISFAVYAALVTFNGVARMAVDFRSVIWKSSVRFALGGLIGVLLVRPFVGVFNGPMFIVVLALFILLTLWMPRLHLYHLFPQPFVVCGFLQVSLGMLFGTSGPLPLIFLLDSDLQKDRLIATAGAMQFIGDIFKTVGFWSTGFAYTDYVPLLSIMFLGILAGTFTGKVSRRFLNDVQAKKIARILTSAVILRMLVVNLVKL